MQQQAIRGSHARHKGAANNEDVSNDVYAGSSELTEYGMGAVWGAELGILFGLCVAGLCGLDILATGTFRPKPLTTRPVQTRITSVIRPWELSEYCYFPNAATLNLS